MEAWRTCSRPYEEQEAGAGQESRPLALNAAKELWVRASNLEKPSEALQKLFSGPWWLEGRLVIYCQLNS